MRVRRGLSALFAIATAVALTSAVAASAAPGGSWDEVPSPHVSSNASDITAMVSTGTSTWAFGWTRAYVGGTFEWRVWGEQWDGSSWTRLLTMRDVETAPAQDFLYGADGTSDTDMWVVGRSLNNSSQRIGQLLIEHWDGQNWTIDNSSPTPGLGSALLAIDARTESDVWAVGETHYPNGSDYNGFVLHRTNLGWAEVPFNPVVPGCKPGFRGELNAVDAVAADDVYVAGWCQSQPVGPPHGFVMHWDGQAWTLTLRAEGKTALRELATGPDGQVWVAGNRDGGNPTYPIVYHGTAAAGWTQVPVRHGAALNGTIDALAVSDKGVVIAGQLGDNRGIQPTQTYALRLGADGRWRKEPVNAVGAVYARAHAMAVEPGGTEWIGGVAVGGTHLDPVSMLARRN